MAAFNEDAREDVFKKEFKRFKRLTNNDIKYIIDFTQPHKFHQICAVLDLPLQSHDVCIDSDQCRSLGLKCLREWKVFKVTTVPGLLVIPNPFLPGYQHLWVTQSLVHYPCLPNISNLDAHMTRTPPGHIWDNTSAKEGNKDSLLYKLRWVTLGYHYDWSSKLYHTDCYSPFPTDLSLLTQFILKALGFDQFKAQAAIVNYYHLDSTLSGHTDHSESDLTAPLISLSFGQSAIFLIGGSTKQHIPLPLLINSGDIIIMSGDSRLAYHGVPKVLQPPNSAAPLVPHCLSETCLKSTLLARTKERENGGEKGTCPFYSHMTSLINRERLKRSRSKSQEYSLETKAVKYDTLCPKLNTAETYAAEIETHTTSTETQTETHTTPPKAHTIIQLEAHTTQPETHTCTTQTDSYTTQIEAYTPKPKTSSSHTATEQILETNDVHRVDCPNCQWVLMNWKYFESYLSYSRINVNVRQVGELTDNL